MALVRDDLPVIELCHSSRLCASVLIVSANYVINYADARVICLYRFTRDYAAFDLYYADDNIRDVIVLIMSFFDDHASLFCD
jgi:hypothetical protein